MGQKAGRDTSGCGSGRRAILSWLFGTFVVIRRGHRGDELPGLVEVRGLDQDLGFGQPVDGERVDEAVDAAAGDGGDAVASEEALDHVRFERAEDARELDEVGIVVLRRLAVVIFRHGKGPFWDAR